jgi:UDP-N-acetylmuramoyl-tripeptide--D-alanyl-D-alanine ligase
VGRRAKAAGIARLYALGPLSAGAADAFGEGGRTFTDHAALATALRADLEEATDAPRVLVKGSRGSAMDRIVNDILAGGGDGGNIHAA